MFGFKEAEEKEEEEERYKEKGERNFFMKHGVDSARFLLKQTICRAFDHISFRSFFVISSTSFRSSSRFCCSPNRPEPAQIWLIWPRLFFPSPPPPPLLYNNKEKIVYSSIMISARWFFFISLSLSLFFLFSAGEYCRAGLLRSVCGNDVITGGFNKCDQEEEGKEEEEEERKEKKRERERVGVGHEGGRRWGR